MTLAPQFVWKCVNCSMRVATHGDLHVNERPLCVQCNAEMEPYQPGDGRSLIEAWGSRSQERF